MLTMVSMVVLLAGVAGLVAQSAWLAARAPGGALELSAEEMRPHILWRSFYVNPDDPRGWVPKLNGLGWTVNFRTPRNAALFAALLVVTCLGAAGLVVSVLVLPPT